MPLIVWFGTGAIHKLKQVSLLLCCYVASLVLTLNLNYFYAKQEIHNKISRKFWKALLLHGAVLWQRYSLLLTYVSLATAFALTAMLSCRSSCLISSIHWVIYFAWNTNYHNKNLLLQSLILSNLFHISHTSICILNQLSELVIKIALKKRLNTNLIVFVIPYSTN